MPGTVSFAANGIKATLSVKEVAAGFAFVIVAIVVLMVGFAVFCDIANVKSFSFTKGLAFYEEGETKKKRFYQRAPTVAKGRGRKNVKR